MNKPVALDICCREGGATKGLQRAGFHVWGFDIEPRKNYPGDEFTQTDGIGILRTLAQRGGEIYSNRLRQWVRPALIWQSWPCQDGNTATAGNRAKGLTDAHRQFIPEARELSECIGIPYVLEQPTSSRKDLIRHDLVLCMDMFKGQLPPPWVQKHRSFEFGHWPGMLPTQPAHPLGWVRGPSMRHFPAPAGHAGYIRGHRHGVVREGPYVAGYGNGGGKGKAWELAHAMGIDWMTGGATERENQFDLQEAIPPVFAEYIGRSLLSRLLDQGKADYTEHSGFHLRPARDMITA